MTARPSVKLSTAFKFFLNNRAVTLTETLVAAGLVGGLSLGYLQISSNHEKSQKKIEAGFEIDMLILDMTQTLSNRRACAQTLGTTVADGQDIPAIKNSAGRTIFQKGNKYGQNLIQIKSMEMSGLDTDADGLGSVEVVVTFEKAAKSIKGKKEEVRNIFLPVKVASGSVVCYPDSGPKVMQDDRQLMCDSLGGTLSGNRCIPPFVGKMCPEFVAGFNEDGTLACDTYP